MTRKAWAVKVLEATAGDDKVFSDALVRSFMNHPAIIKRSQQGRSSDRSMRYRLSGVIFARRIIVVTGVITATVPGRPAWGRQDSVRVAEAYRRQRAEMAEFIARRGVTDPATLRAMRVVPRHEFVPPELRSRAYGDHPLPIGLGQTISQPYVVAYMTEMLHLEPGMTVLEVGTGSGYQAAVLAAMGCQVFTIEIFRELADAARERLVRLGYANTTVRHADGHYGWIEEAPFDAVIVTAAAGFIPPALIDQLKPGGRMMIPVGSVYGVQNLILIGKDSAGTVRTRNLLPVRFVPMLSGLR